MGKHANSEIYRQIARQAQPEQEDEENPGAAVWDDDAWGGRNDAEIHHKRIEAEANGQRVGEWKS